MITDTLTFNEINKNNRSRLWKTNKNNRSWIWKTILFIILLALVGASGYFFYQYQKVKGEFQNSQIGTKKAADEEAKKLVAEVGKLMILPAIEVPTVATISDISKLKDQPFFLKAKNGNKLLIYTNAKLAILYDPKIQKIVNVAPLNLTTQQPPQARIALRNGTNTPLTSKIEQEIKKTFPEINIVLKEQGKKNTYEKTIVIPLHDAAKDAASNLAKMLKATVESLPSGETKPDGADILVILGEDKI